MITLTLTKIQARDPQFALLEKIRAANPVTQNQPFPLESVLDSNGLADTLWLTRCLPEHDLLWRQFAHWCAKQVVHFTNDKRVHDCLDIVEAFNSGSATAEQLESAWLSIRSVEASAKSEEAAAAARSASAAAAWSASWAAQAASAAAWSAASWSAIRTAPNSEIWKAAAEAVKAVEILQTAELREILNNSSVGQPTNP